MLRSSYIYIGSVDRPGIRLPITQRDPSIAKRPPWPVSRAVMLDAAKSKVSPTNQQSQLPFFLQQARQFGNTGPLCN